MYYLALLRAINVGGNRIVKMQALRESVAVLGFSQVSTYIQSGNLLFESPESDQRALTQKLEAHLLEHWGFEIPCTLRNTDEMQALSQELQAPDQSERLNIYYLGGPPVPEATDRLSVLEGPGISWQLNSRELILRTPRELQDKRLNSSQWLERQLGTWATARNYKTSLTLAERLRRDAPQVT
jgi:uncharacterized protein (DUF1697 family)